MTSTLGRIAAGITIGSLLLAGAALDKRATLEAENDALRAQITLVRTADGVATALTDRLGEVIADLHAERDLLDELERARAPFLDDVAAFAEQWVRGEGKVEAATLRERVLAAQATVLAERADPAVVESARAEVAGATGELAALIDEYDAEQERRAAQALVRAPGGSSAGSGASESSASPAGGAVAAAPVSGYGTIRAALDTVGGGGVPLEESTGACGLACASSRGLITFHPNLAGESWGKILWVMSHELAHIHQFRVWNALQGSSAYASLYGGDAEHLANCMAEVRGFASIGCSSDQQGFAAGVWDGRVG